MNISRCKLTLLCSFLIWTLPLTASAATYDFEDGDDGDVIVSPLEGVEFFDTGGRSWIYGDWRTGFYNSDYRPQDPANPGQPDPDNNFFAWLGTAQDTGKINFTYGATYIAVSYSSQDFLTVTGYNAGGQVVDTQVGDPSLFAGDMPFIRVDAPDLKYIIIGDANRANYWIIDNIDTDAFTVDCLIDPDCDNGIFCDGMERCDTQTYTCEDGDLPCLDDGLFCNGPEECDESLNMCAAVPPCAEDETCDEDEDRCIAPGSPDSPDEPDIPELEIKGGTCCSC